MYSLAISIELFWIEAVKVRIKPILNGVDT